MKLTNIIFLCVVVCAVKINAQEKYFICDQNSVRIDNGSFLLHLPNLSKNEIEKKIFAFIKQKKYLYRPFYSNENTISFRDFVMICDKSKCGSDLVAKNIFRLTYDKGFVRITLTNDIYTSYFGGELIINNNDDVASKGNLPFAIYDFEIPEQYTNEYPESIYTYNKSGKVKVKNSNVQKIILNFYHQYITDLKVYLEN